MAFQTDMVYVRYEFSWQDTPEIQDTGLWCHLTHPEGMELDWDTAVNAAAEKAVEAWVTAMPKPVFSPSLIATRVIAYHYDQLLKTVLNRGEAGFTGDNVWKGSAINDLPPENTLVLGLYSYDPASYVANRARRRGRMYLPTPGVTQIGNGGQLSEGVQLQWCQYGALLLAELQETIQVPSDGHLRPQVVSRGGKGGTIASANNEVTHVRMGRVIDTQRRRRNKLPENYVTVAL
jgi:hypothetical protein